MREASVSCYMPGILQINCVINFGQKNAGGLTTAGDHDTPCDHCQFEEINACFWLCWKSFELNMIGWHHKECNSPMHNNNVHHFLYGNFIDEQHEYLHGPTEMQAGLPHLSLPYCVERDIKHLFPNEDGWPFIARVYKIKGYVTQSSKNKKSIVSTVYDPFAQCQHNCI